ncbi:NUDIX hydrolase [Saccharicrinis sp. FJH62]|uniref:NUDIX hydrolase n=1 Tax=Saccharicrinis sp. FJH62 TaxID=3344657 RepID=UPI0035D47C5E
MIVPVYFDDRVLKLTDNLEDTIDSGFDAIHEYSSHSDLKLFLEKFDSNHLLKQGILYSSGSIEKLMEHLKSCFKYIEAAGGIVCNKKGEVLFIYRRGNWDLPKGKKKKGERVEDTAVREVKEECGLNDCNVGEYLMATYHTYHLKDKKVLKKTYWYRMTTAELRLKPQLEEDILKAEWISKTDLYKVLPNTYRSVKDVIEKI